jgi:hypothetical protein
LPIRAQQHSTAAEMHKLVLVLHFVLVASKIFGVLPLTYNASLSKIQSSRPWVAYSLIFLLTVYVHDIILIFRDLEKYIVGANVTVNDFLTTVGSWVYNLYFCSVIALPFTQVKKIVDFVKTLRVLDSKVPLLEFERARRVINCTVFASLFWFSILWFHALFARKDYHNLQDPIFTILNNSAQVLVECQFWCFCYLIFSFFVSLNKSLCEPNLSHAQLEILRDSAGTMFDLCDELNRIYGVTLLFYLVTRNVNAQIEIFSITAQAYKFIQFHTDLNIFEPVKWLSFELCRMALLFWMCETTASEVLKFSLSYIIICSLTQFYWFLNCHYSQINICVD